jgi:transposase-like protein
VTNHPSSSNEQGTCKVITMAMYAKIRRMYFRDRLSISEIARRTSLTCNTIKKWIRAAEGEPQYQRKALEMKLTPFQAQLVTHHCHIIETGNDSWRFKHRTATAKARIKERERKQADEKARAPEPF